MQAATSIARRRFRASVSTRTQVVFPIMKVRRTHSNKMTRSRTKEGNGERGGMAVSFLNKPVRPKPSARFSRLCDGRLTSCECTFAPLWS